MTPLNNITILRFHLVKGTKYEKTLLKNLIRQIENESPFDAMGFFKIELSTFTSIVSTFMTYLIILVQFKDSTDTNLEPELVSNSTDKASQD